MANFKFSGAFLAKRIKPRDFGKIRKARSAKKMCNKRKANIDMDEEIVRKEQTEKKSKESKPCPHCAPRPKKTATDNEWTLQNAGEGSGYPFNKNQTDASHGERRDGPGGN